jgi:hypothetical protein
MVCPICKNSDATVIDNFLSRPDITFAIDCPQCGDFIITDSAKAELNHIADAERWKISAWINDSKPEIITTVVLETARGSTPPSLHHRADRMLRWISTEFPPGSLFSTNTLGKIESTKVFLGGAYINTVTKLMSSRLVPIGWNKSINEMLFMVTEVLSNEMGLLVSQNNQEYQVSPKGLLYLEGRRESVSSVGFCAMWFNPSVRFIYDAGYEPFRVDGKEHNNRIDDEIVANIKSAKFMVADLTGHRGGVYYEAGLAHGLGLEVIFTCKEKRATHFDIRQYNTIFWNPDNMADFREKIKNRILASSIGRGPLDPNRA